MTGPGDAFPLLLMLLAVPALLVVPWWLTHRRTRRVQEWARQVGWTYVGWDRGLARRWRGRPFGTGDARRVRELVVGQWGGRPAQSFRYEYTTGSGKNRSTTTHHVVSLALPAYLPTVELTPESVLTRVASAFGGQDIQLESEDFNRAWRITAPDERFAHAVLHPRLMERLLQADARGVPLRIEGTDILCWTGGAPRLETIATRLQVMAAVVDAVPRFVWLDHGHDPGA